MHSLLNMPENLPWIYTTVNTNNYSWLFVPIFTSFSSFGWIPKAPFDILDFYHVKTDEVTPFCLLIYCYNLVYSTSITVCH